MTRKGRIRWQMQSGHWSDWYDFGTPIPEYLKEIEIVALHVEEEMTRIEYEEMINVKSTNS